MQSPQPSTVTPAPSSAPIDHSSITNPSTTISLNRHLLLNHRPSCNRPLLHPDHRLDAYVLLIMYLILADYSQPSCT
eukprot:403459-Pleurochrysis_carterae.AAC.1